MKVYRTAEITAVWRHMAKVDKYSISKVNFFMKIVGKILGFLDPNSVKTISQRTILIDSFIRKLKPKNIVEIGSGFSSRSKRFKKIRCYRFDLPYFSKKEKEVIPFEIGKDTLKVDVKESLFIVEGVTMYLQKKDIIDLLNQIKKYKGHILIDFFDRERSSRIKSLNEKIYKFIFKLVIGRNFLFDYRLKNIEEGISLLEDFGFKNVRHYTYKVPKTLDVLFYGKF